MNTQLIWTGSEYEIADSSNSEEPEWPVCDAGGRWTHKQFDGQRAWFDRANVHLGFQAEEMPESDVSALDMDDLPSDVFSAGNRWYKSI